MPPQNRVMIKNFFNKPAIHSLILFTLLVISIGQSHAQQICMVSADFQTGETYIVSWEPIDDVSEIDSIFIYRKQGVQTGFSHIGSVDAVDGGPTNYVDDTALTYDTTKYSIAYLYNDGSISPRSIWHQAVVMNYSGSGEFVWTKYKIENQLDESYIGGYQVLKDNLGIGSFLGLGGLLNSILNFVDLTYILTPNARYVVEVTLPSCEVIQKSNIHTSRSNIKTLTVNPATPSDSTVTNPIFEDGVSVLNVPNISGFDYLLSPNPSDDLVSIVLGSDGKIDGISITNIEGRNVYYATDVTSKSFSLSTSSYPNGIYFVHVESNGIITSKRLVVNH